MSFVYDASTLPDGKSDATPPVGDPDTRVTATEWNTVMDAINDLRDAILGAEYIALASTPAAEVSGANSIRLRNNAGVLEQSVNGAAYAEVGSDVTNITSVEKISISSSSATVSEVGHISLRNNSGVLEASINGAAYAPIGVVSLGTFGSTPAAEGASVTNNVITLQPASASHPGGVSTAAQTLAGAKTLSALLTCSLGINATAASDTAVITSTSVGAGKCFVAVGGNGVCFDGSGTDVVFSGSSNSPTGTYYGVNNGNSCRTLTMVASGANSEAGRFSATGSDGIGLKVMSTTGYGIVIECDTTSPVRAALRMVPQDTAPSSPQKGDVYYNSGDDKLYVYNGAWVDLTA